MAYKQAPEPCVLDFAQTPRFIMSAKHRLCERVVMTNLFTSSLWLADKTLQVFTKVIIPARRTTKGSKVAFNEFTWSVVVFSSLVRAINVICGLEKYDYLALNETSLHGVKTFDICSYRGVPALALKTLWKHAGFMPLIHIYLKLVRIGSPGSTSRWKFADGSSSHRSSSDCNLTAEIYKI
jgi:hypothetical protein